MGSAPSAAPTPDGSTRSSPTPNGDPPFLVLFDPDAEIVLDAYGTQLSHETWILDPAGILRARFDGARDGSSSLALEVGEMIARWPLGAPAKDRYVSHPS